MENVIVEVVYPRDAGAPALRTEFDWDRDVEPEARDGDVARFAIALDRPFLYFKPVLRRGGAVSWAQGDNQIVAASEGRRRVYPHFDAAPHCGECELQRVPSSLAAAGLRVRVFEPDGYRENPLRRYPVLYMQDGQNLFFAEESFLGETWRVQDTVRALARMDLIEPALVVGIQPADRDSQYTKPGYEAYGRALALELKPWIDSRYRTLAGAEHTSVVGSSLGGVVSLYLAWQHPDAFGAAACLSSTFAYRDDLMDRVAREEKRPVRIYLDSGWPRDNYEVTLAMRNRLVARGYRLGADLVHFAFPEARHSESAWAARLHLPLQHLLGRVPERRVSEYLASA